MLIHPLIAAINPEVFCQLETRAKAKAILRDALGAGDKLAYLKAAKRVTLCETNVISLEKLWDENPFKLPGQRSPVEQHTLVLDNPSEPLEPIYFELLRELSAHENWTIEKVLDTASATPGSGLSLDLSRRSLTEQHEASKLLLFMRQRIRGFIQEWQKWREQKWQLHLFIQARTVENPARESARHQLSHQWQQGDHIVGADREATFEHWLRESESELRTTTEMGRDLLAGDLHLLRLQANWLKPYLRSRPTADRLGDPTMVTAFNTATFEIVLLVTLDSQLEHWVQTGDLPKLLLDSKHRRSQPMLVIEIKFTAIPERVAGGAYAYRGRAELRFTSYALNESEREVLRREVQRDEWGEMLGLLESNTSGHWDALLSDLDELLTEAKAETEKPKPSEASSDPNPFAALFDFSDWFGGEEKVTPVKSHEPLISDSEIESVIRSLALLEARQRCLEIYERSKDIFRLPQF